MFGQGSDAFTVLNHKKEEEFAFPTMEEFLSDEPVRESAPEFVIPKITVPKPIEVSELLLDRTSRSRFFDQLSPITERTEPSTPVVHVRGDDEQKSPEKPPLEALKTGLNLSIKLDAKPSPAPKVDEWHTVEKKKKTPRSPKAKKSDPDVESILHICRKNNKKKNKKKNRRNRSKNNTPRGKPRVNSGAVARFGQCPEEEKSPRSPRQKAGKDKWYTPKSKSIKNMDKRFAPNVGKQNMVKTDRFAGALGDRTRTRTYSNLVRRRQKSIGLDKAKPVAASRFGGLVPAESYKKQIHREEYKF